MLNYLFYVGVWYRDYDVILFLLACLFDERVFFLTLCFVVNLEGG